MNQIMGHGPQWASTGTGRQVERQSLKQGLGGGASDAWGSNKLNLERRAPELEGLDRVTGQHLSSTSNA